MKAVESMKKNVWQEQQERNDALVRDSRYMRDSVTSSALPLHWDIRSVADLSDGDVHAAEAVGKEAARVAVRTLASLSKINELDHLGGGLDLIPALTLTLGVTDFERVQYTIEHAHTSIGYYAVLAALGYLDKQHVIDGFRRSLDIAGHVSWVPGGTELNGGRLGVMVPAAAGLALGLKARHSPCEASAKQGGEGSWVLCHCGDAGWISGQ
ncbi:MAG TPA: hypothetical protein VIH35_08885, partial [Kiritimatiellia bacterium]